MRRRHVKPAALNRLPAELLYFVLGFCDIYTLSAFATTSKRICIVFLRHSHALVKSALRTSLWCPHPTVYRLIVRALRLREHLMTHGQSELAQAVSAINAAQPYVASVQGRVFPTRTCYNILLKDYSISFALLPLVIERATMARTLELRYSRTVKDKHSLRLSALTESESEHFQLALHRVWLLSDVYTAHRRFRTRILPHSSPTEEHVATWLSLLDPIPTSQIWHLSNLFDWFEAEEQLGDFTSACLENARSRILFRTPSAFLFQTASISASGSLEFTDEARAISTGKHLPALFQQLLIRRGVVPDGTRATYEASGASLVNLVPIDCASTDVCALAHLPVPLPRRQSRDLIPLEQRIHSPNGMFLWNKSNWEYLTDRDLDGTLSDLLLRNLAENTEERFMLTEHVRDLGVVMHASPGVVLAQIIGELFTLADDIQHPLDKRLAESVRQDNYNHISPDDWLCAKCIREFLRHRLFAWWALQRRNGKVATAPPLPTENCRHGVLCHRLLARDRSGQGHVRTLNHLCHSTNGERKAVKQEGRDRRRAERSQDLERWYESHMDAATLDECGPSH